MEHQTIQSVFGIADMQSLAAKFGYNTKTEGDLTIFVATDNSVNPDTSACYLKGMVVDSEGHILAPGVTMPVHPASMSVQELAALIMDPSNTITQAVDGILVKLYYDRSGDIHVSSNGQLLPTKGWGPPSSPSILDMFLETCSQFSEVELSTNYCYYMRLVHPSHSSFSSSRTPTIYLTDVIDVRSLQHIPLSTIEYFTNKPRDLSQQPRDELVSRLLTETCEPRPVTSDFGVIVILPTWSYVRIVDRNCQAAIDILPNDPDPNFHWIHLIVSDDQPGTTDDLDEAVNALESDRVKTYLSFYPARRQSMEEARKKFCTTVNNIVNDMKSGRFPEYCLRYSEDIRQSFGTDVPSPGQLAYHLASQDYARIKFFLRH